jgi:hypothetical protein
VTVDTTQDGEDAPPASASASTAAPIPAQIAAEALAAPTSENHASPDAMTDMLALLAAAPEATTHDADVVETPKTPEPPEAVSSPTASIAISVESANTTAEPSGEHFMAWLKQAVALRRLIINDAKALVHTVDDTVFLVTPGIFQRYAQEFPKIGTLAKLENQPDWRWAQKRFEGLGAHRKQPGGLNIWTCNVVGPRRTQKLHGHLLLEPGLLFEAVPPNNPYLSLNKPLATAPSSKTSTG